MQDKLIRIYSVKLREPSFAITQNFNKIKASIPFTWHLPQMIKRKQIHYENEIPYNDHNHLKQVYHMPSIHLYLWC